MLRQLEAILQQLDEMESKGEPYTLSPAHIRVLVKAIKAFTNLQAAEGSGVKVIHSDAGIKIVAE
jgi:hypothetical protein